MRLSIALVVVAVHVIVAYPAYQTADDCFGDAYSQGYVRYVDANGAQRLVAYNYPQAIHSNQLHSGNPFLRVYQYSDQDQVAREQHFRAWNMQRYQAMKSEADKLYAQGKIPSPDMLARLQQLEQFATQSQTALSSEMPEMKQAREEHLKLWNEERLKVLNWQAAKANDEHQKARNEHLRLYDQQVQLLNQYQHEKQPLAAIIVETPEVQHAKEEHLRIVQAHQFNASPSPSSSPSSSQAMIKSSQSVSEAQPQMGHISAASPLVETPEVQRAKEEHLRLWNIAKLRAEKADGFHSQAAQQSQSTVSAEVQPIEVQAQAAKIFIQTPEKSEQSQSTVSAEAQPIEVQAQAAKIFIQTPEKSEQTKSHSSAASFSLSNRISSEGNILVETPEVQRAKEEHLRLWNEAKLRAEKADGVQPQAEFQSQGHQVKVSAEAQHIEAQAQGVKFLVETAAKSENSVSSNTQSDASPAINAQPITASISTRISSEPTAANIVVETPEVQRAKEEHLRLWHEAKVRAEEADKIQAAEQSTFITAPAIKSSSGEFITQRIGADSELNAEQLAQMERMREEQKMHELQAFKEAERLREEKRQMAAEQMLLQAADEARLQKDLKEQFAGERVRKVATEIPSAPGFYFVDNQYQNPFLYQYNTPAASVRFASGQPQYLRYPGSQAFAIQPSYIYNGINNPAGLKLISPQYLPTQIQHQSKDAKALYELEQATREHFRAHEIALKQLDLAHEKDSTKAAIDCNH